MVIKDCILKATEILRASGVDTPMLDARVLLCHVLDKDDVYIVLNADAELEKAYEDTFFSCVQRRSAHEPVAYIVNEKEFMSLSFYVDENVLVPRPDTEHLAELAIEMIQNNGYKKIADFCTGSGALAVSVTKNCPDATVVGYDISEGALKVADINKKHLCADNVTFEYTDVLNELPKISEKFDLVISNPPYIDIEDMKKLDKTVSEYEPHIALYGGEDGLDFYRTITENAEYFLKKGGVLAFEVGHTQASDVAELMSKSFSDVKIKKDYAGIERVVYGVYVPEL